MNSNLKYVVTIPSIDIPGHISIDDLILLGSKDNRYQQLKNSNSFLSKYLDSFRTPFGTKANPSIVVRDKTLPKVDADRLTAFRNAIAVSSVIYSMMESCLYNNRSGCKCTDLFDFHPINVSSDGDDFSIKTAHIIGCDNRIEDFKGQTTLAVPYPETVSPSFDKELMKTLLDLLERKPRRKKEKEFQNRVMRALDMAYYALRSPFVNLGNKTDFGVLISLWVSAFETLANPYTKDVHFKDVSTLIKQISWKNAKLRRKNYVAIAYNGKTTLPVQIYGRLYHTRNMYLHGNIIPKRSFEFNRRKEWGTLRFQVPALFRCVLIYLLQTNGFTPESQYPSLQRNYEKVLLKPNSP